VSCSFHAASLFKCLFFVCSATRYRRPCLPIPSLKLGKQKPNHQRIRRRRQLPALLPIKLSLTLTMFGYCRIPNQSSKRRFRRPPLCIPSPSPLSPPPNTAVRPLARKKQGDNMSLIIDHMSNMTFTRHRVRGKCVEHSKLQTDRMQDSGSTQNDKVQQTISVDESSTEDEGDAAAATAAAATAAASRSLSLPGMNILTGKLIMIVVVVVVVGLRWHCDYDDEYSFSFGFAHVVLRQVTCRSRLTATCACFFLLP
jgi:hypothetical protein